LVRVLAVPFGLLSRLVMTKQSLGCATIINNFLSIAQPRRFIAFTQGLGSRVWMSADAGETQTIINLAYSATTIDCLFISRAGG
jgi:hypothetical protein